MVGRKPNRLWTVAFNEQADQVPLVMVHGFASGVGLWCLNYDALAADRPVYAFDNLGEWLSPALLLRRALRVYVCLILIWFVPLKIAARKSIFVSGCVRFLITIGSLVFCERNAHASGNADAHLDLFSPVGPTQRSNLTGHPVDHDSFGFCLLCMRRQNFQDLYY